MLIPTLGATRALAQPLKGTVLWCDGENVTVRTGDGRDRRLRLTRGSLRCGDLVELSLRDNQVVRARKLGAGWSWGRVYAVNSAQRTITVAVADSTQVRMGWDEGTAVVKDLRPAGVLALHKGELIAFSASSGRVRCLLDEVSFLARELEPEFGPMLGWGEVVRVALQQPTSGLLELEGPSGKSVRFVFDSSTRWQLGARFRSPEDFLEVESFVFGKEQTASLVVGRRAVRYLFQKAVREL